MTPREPVKRPESTTAIGAEWRTLTRSAGETEAIGAALADALPPPAQGPAILYLSGELGAGKTTLARGFLRRRGLADPARSPTFTLLECYELADVVAVHVDLYRLREPQELEALGLRDLARPHHVWLIEWPERGAGYLPSADLAVTLSVSSRAEHAVAAAARTPLGVSWLEGAVEFRARST